MPQTSAHHIADIFKPGFRHCTQYVAAQFITFSQDAEALNEKAKKGYDARYLMVDLD